MNSRDDSACPGLVEVVRDEAIVTVELCRPEKHNALSRGLLEQLLLVLNSVREQRDVRALVLASRGSGAFCSGADLRELSGMSEAEVIEFIALGKSCAMALEELPFPTIAAVHGSALGGGLELALACDLITAASSASIGLPEVKLGIIPGFGGVPRLIRRVGYSRAQQLVLRGEIISAGLGLEWGLVNAVGEPSDTRSIALSWAMEFGRASASAIRSAKLALSDAYRLDFLAGLDAETSSFMSAFRNDDRAEGIAAFLSRRAPVFKSR